MKISPKDLPAHIAEALKPRTFAHELPKDGQSIEALCKTYGWSRGVFDPDDRFIENANGFMELTDSVLWRHVLELEDEAHEPERELPEPGSIFETGGRLALRGLLGRWNYICDATGMTPGLKNTDGYQPTDEIPTDWTPLSDLIAKAARAGELEAELRKEAAKLAECNQHYLDASDAMMLADKKAKAAQKKVTELEAKIKQQDELLDLADNFVFRNAHGRICTDDTNVVELLDGLEARRKAREASE